MCRSCCSQGMPDPLEFALRRNICIILINVIDILKKCGWCLRSKLGCGWPLVSAYMSNVSVYLHTHRCTCTCTNTHKHHIPPHTHTQTACITHVKTRKLNVKESLTLEVALLFPIIRSFDQERPFWLSSFMLKMSLGCWDCLSFHNPMIRREDLQGIRLSDRKRRQNGCWQHPVTPSHCMHARMHPSAHTSC